mgnify:FL=1
MKEKLMGVLSIFTALFASLCWSGTLILAALGLGSVGSAYFSNMTKFKPLFVLLTGLLIYKGYVSLEKKKASKFTKIFFYISSFLAIIMLYLPTIINYLN